MIPVRGYRGHKVAVLGLGRSGMATARALQAGGAIALCWDDNEESRARAEAEGLSLHDLRRDRALDDVVALIVSPGIPHLYPAPHPVVRAAWEAGVVVDNDIGLFFRSFSSPDWDDFETLPKVVAVTGSNGKSTTSALIHHILREQGRASQLAGNIGRGVLDIAPAQEGEVIVLELSSYQTELARALAPDIAVFLNLSPDHLDRHGGIGGYFAAKRRLFIEGGPERAIIGVDEDEGRFLASQLREGAGSGDPVIRISAARRLKGPDWTVHARKGFLAEWRRGRQVAAIDLRDMRGLPGTHNHQNACAAYAVCRSLGLAPRLIEKSLASYPGLPHRAQFLGERDGVRFVNDSKATNADAAARALAAFGNIRWILGGQGKEGGIAGIAEQMQNVRKAYLIGEAAPVYAAQLGDLPHEICETLERAFARAVAEAEAGDTVLLAPAAASFDQYRDFEARGEAFMALVVAHLGA